MADLPSIYSEDFGKTDMAGWEPIEEYNSTDAYMEDMAANGDNLSFTPPDTSGFGKYGGDGTDTAVDTDKASGSSGSGSQGSGNSGSGSSGGNSGGSGSKQGQDSSSGNSSGGNKGGAIFSDKDILDHTYVYSLAKNNDESTYYKIVVNPAKDGTPISNEVLHTTSLDAYVTSLNIEQNVRQQVNYTLGNTVYLYVFGEAVVNLTVGGFGFWQCKDNGGSDKFDTPDKLLDFYRDNNVSKHGLYCKVLLGDKTFLGYLISSDIGLTDQTLGLVAFKFQFLGVFQEDN